MSQMNFNRIPSPDADWNYDAEENQDHDEDGAYGEFNKKEMKLLFIIAAFDAPKMLIDPYLIDGDGRLTKEGRQAYD